MRGVNFEGYSDQFCQRAGEGPSEWKGLRLIWQSVDGTPGLYRADAGVGDRNKSGTDDCG
jgi:hypothetical protein